MKQVPTLWWILNYGMEDYLQAMNTLMRKHERMLFVWMVIMLVNGMSIGISSVLIHGSFIYPGWINPELVEKYHFEASAAEAWEKNGGGTFSFKDPTGSGKKKGSGRFNAKV